MTSSAQTSTQGAVANVPIRFQNFHTPQLVACPRGFSVTPDNIHNMEGYTTTSNPTDIAERNRVAIAAVYNESKKKRKSEEGRRLRNGKEMNRLDAESANVELTDRLKQYGQGPCMRKQLRLQESKATQSPRGMSFLPFAFLLLVPQSGNTSVEVHLGSLRHVLPQRIYNLSDGAFTPKRNGF